MQISEERFTILITGTIKSIPFNIIVALLLTVEMLYKKVPTHQVLIWLAALSIINLIRLASCYIAISTKRYSKKKTAYLIEFLFLLSLNATAWIASYYFFLPYLLPIDEIIILLVLGGIALGSIATLSIYLPAFYLFASILYIPLILINFSFMQQDRLILSLLFILFLIMMVMIARFNSKLMLKAMSLSTEKDELIKDLKHNKAQLEKTLQHIKKISNKDALTDLYNRRYFDKQIKTELNQAKRNGYPLCLLIMDIDNFKIINDQYGHPVGDEFLEKFAVFLKQKFRRATDTVFRYGGDEFAAILANMDYDKAILFCEELKKTFKTEVNQYSKISLSMGMVSIPPDVDISIDSALSAADKLLYKAKNKGKDLVMTRKLST